MWGKNDMLAEDAWQSSFTTAESHGGADNGPNPYNSTDPRFYSFLNSPAGDLNTTMDYKNVEAAIQFLHSKPSEPFVIFLPLLKPHPPYSAPEPYYSMIEPSSLHPLRASNLPGKPDFHKLIRKYRRLDQVEDSDAFFRKLHAVYLGSISYSDFLFGRLLAAVRETGFEDSTTVALWAVTFKVLGDECTEQCA